MGRKAGKKTRQKTTDFPLFFWRASSFLMSRPPLTRPCKTTQRTTGIPVFEAFFARPEMPNLLPPPHFPSRFCFFCLFLASPRFFEKCNFLAIHPLHWPAGPSTQARRDPQKERQPSQSQSVLRFLARWYFSCFFSLRGRALAGQSMW